MEITKELLEKIESLSTPKIIAISGFGGSGKSTFATMLGEHLNTPVVGVDSFQKDTYDLGASLGETMDFTRLVTEVLSPFKTLKDIEYGEFDWASNSINRVTKFKNKGTLIVEGVGLLRPELMTFFDITIWMDVSLSEAEARAQKRDKKKHHDTFDKKWYDTWKNHDIHYFEKYKPNEVADFIIKNF